MADTETMTLNYEAMLTGLGGGLALFLYGMRKMTDALKAVAGNRMKMLLARLTRNRFTGLASGALITATVQSSSVTTVLLVGFITAGLMNFSQSLGVIIGANIGTTITAQIIAFKVTQYALLLIAAGFLTEILARSRTLMYYGIMMMGLGLIFFGMELMSDATAPLRSYQPFIDAMQQMTNPLWGVLIGSVFTALVQSSSATTGIIIVLATQGLISLEAGIALVLGANVGTCVTVVLSALGKPREAMQAAVAHVIFNLLGALLWVFFIPLLAGLARWMAFAAEGEPGDTPRQIANAHTIFNSANALIFIWLTTPLARLIERLVPSRPPEINVTQPQYLDQLYLEQPAMAIDQVRRELARLGSMSRKMTGISLETLVSGSAEDLKQLQHRDQEVDELHAHIISYLSKLALRDLIEGQPEQIHGLIAAANYIENIGDVIESGLVADGYKRLQRGVTVSTETRSLLEALHEQMCRSLDQALEALAEQDVEKAQAVKNSKAAFNASLEQLREHLNERLIADRPQRLDHFRIEVSVIDHFKRIHTLSRRIADVTLETAGLHDSSD